MGITRRISVILASVLVCLSVVGLAYASAQAEIQIVGQEKEGVINLESPEVTLFSNATFNQTLTDNTYLRLDGTNDPVGTSQVIFQSGNGRIVSTNGAGAISVQTSTGTAGAISFGNTADIGISSDGTVSGYDYDGTLVTKQKASNPAGEVEFLWLEEAGDWRFALPGSGADLATGNPRSLIVGYGAANNASDVYCSHNGFDKIDCNTGATGGDLGVADDVQIGGNTWIGDVLTVGNTSSDVGSIVVENSGNSFITLYGFNQVGFNLTSYVTGKGWLVRKGSADDLEFYDVNNDIVPLKVFDGAVDRALEIAGNGITYINRGGANQDFYIEGQNIRMMEVDVRENTNGGYIYFLDNIFELIRGDGTLNKAKLHAPLYINSSKDEALLIQNSTSGKDIVRVKTNEDTYGNSEIFMNGTVTVTNSLATPTYLNVLGAYGTGLRINAAGTGAIWRMGTDASGNFAFESNDGNNRMFYLLSGGVKDAIKVWNNYITFNDLNLDTDFFVKSNESRYFLRGDAGENWLQIFDGLVNFDGINNETNFTGTVNLDLDFSHLPIGYTQDWWNTTYIPTGMFLMNGSDLDRTTYASCFAVFGLQYGNSSENNFGLPNVTDKGIIYDGNNFDIASEGGEINHTLTAQELVSHRHEQQYPAVVTRQTGIAASGNPQVGQLNVYTQYTGGSDAFNILDPYIVAGGKIVRC